MVAHDAETAVTDERDPKKVREHWLQLSREYESGRLTREEFCAQKKLSLATFDKWRGIFVRENLATPAFRHNRKAPQEKRSKIKKQSATLLPVVITPAVETRQAIEIRTSQGHLVSMPISVCPTVLKEIFKALRDM